MAVALSLDNVFIANLANAHVLLGFFHGSYGIGTFRESFLVCTLLI